MDIVCVSHLRWDFVFQRPQHLLSRACRQGRVLYIEEPVFDDGPSRLTIADREHGVQVVVPVLERGLSLQAQQQFQTTEIPKLLCDHPITDFVQSSPDACMPPSQRTEIRILFDAAALYIGARMFDSLGAKGVRSALARRDQVMNGDNNLTSDRIAFVFDTFRDKNNRTWFELNPDGVKGDHQNGDPTYDPVWEGATNIDSLGWTAEFRIPYSQLRFSRATDQIWGMQIWREINRRAEQDMWAFWRSNEYGGPAYFGTLEGNKVVLRPRQGEIVPYATTRSKLERSRPGDPYHSTNEMRYRAGGDVKLNLTSNLTLDGTVNPDFGQVEVDPAVVNLSVFETTFSEKRPFFVSNSGYFSTGGISCYFCSNVSSLSLIYTRRIGRSPQ